MVFSPLTKKCFSDRAIKHNSAKPRKSTYFRNKDTGLADAERMAIVILSTYNTQAKRAVSFDKMDILNTINMIQLRVTPDLMKATKCNV